MLRVSRGINRNVQGCRLLMRRNANVKHNSSGAQKQSSLSQPLDAAPPAPRSRGGVIKPLFITTLGLSVGGAGILGYSLYDPNFRKEIEKNVPYSSVIFDLILTNSPGPDQGAKPRLDVEAPIKAPKAPAHSKDGETNHVEVPKKSAQKVNEEPVAQKQGGAPQQASDDVANVLIADAAAAGQLVNAAAPTRAADAVADRILGLAESPSSLSTTKGSAPAASTPESHSPQTATGSPSPAAPPGNTGEGNSAAGAAKTLPADLKGSDREHDAVKRQAGEDKARAEKNASFERTLSERLDEARAAALEALRVHALATEGVAAHAKQLKEAVDNETGGGLKEDNWAHVSSLFEDRQKALAEARQAALIAEHSLNELQHFMDLAQSDNITKSNPALGQAQNSARQMALDIRAAMSDAAKSADNQSNVMAQYREMYENGKSQVQEQPDSATPNVQLGTSGRLSDDELNEIIAHAHGRVDQLRKQLVEQQQMAQQQLEAAVNEQRLADERLEKEHLERELEHQRIQFEAEKKQWDIEAQASAERELRQQLVRQAAAHSDHLSEVLRTQREELGRRFERELKQLVIFERNLIVTELSQHLARARGVEAALAVRSNLEQRLQNMQALWLASESLMKALETEPVGVAWEDRLHPLAKEISAVQRSSGDEFVGKVLATVSQKALERGVWTAANLRKRFDTVRRSCERLALLDQDGDEYQASLLRYFLSYVQSFLVVRRPPRFLDEEDEVEPGELDTFDLLSHAAHFVSVGDLEQAVRYVSQLKGVPRRVAGDWLAEARLFLEVRQAATAVNALASSRRLGSIF